MEVSAYQPCLVLMCSEEKNWFTHLQTKIAEKDQRYQVITITADDDALSKFSIAKIWTCIRNYKDCIFFAGPCTGGSSWNRLNRSIGESTNHAIMLKQKTYWQLWNVFAEVLIHTLDIDAVALLELPRSCDYWKDERMLQMIDGTDSNVHDFDGCMYGLKSMFKRTQLPIKKPWRIVTWGITFADLTKVCDKSHEHASCEGRGTRATQTYTSQIVSTIFHGLNKRLNELQPSSTQSSFPCENTVAAEPLGQSQSADTSCSSHSSE